MKKELIYSFSAFLAGVATIVVAPALSDYSKLAGVALEAPPMRAAEQEVYVATGFVSALPTVFSIVLISILIAGLCAFIVKKQSK